MKASQGLTERDTRALEQLGGNRSARLTLLLAPAGAGKTRLLRLWASRQQAAGQPVAWLSLQAEDNDLACFWTDLLAALEDVCPLYASASTDNPESAMTGLINCLACIPGRLVLILDDYHLVTNEAVHDAIRLLLDYPPPGLRLVIASRDEPPLQIPRLRARRQLAEIRLDK